MPDQQYPKYDVTIGWTEDGDTPGTRKENGCGLHTIMEREPIDIENKAIWYKNVWFPEYVERHKIMSPVFDKVTITPTKFETWCLTWFNHWTYDIGQTDQEVLASFDRYVERVKNHNRKICHEAMLGYDEEADDCYGIHRPDGMMCLMGAQDRWRWRGTDDTAAPCRCENCKKNGIIYINH